VTTTPVPPRPAAPGASWNPRDPASLLEARLLGALRQVTWNLLPEGWRDLEPPDGGTERPAAALLLRIAEEPDVDAMQAAAREIHDRLVARHRERGEEEEDADPAETPWSRLVAALGALHSEDDPPHLYAFPLWSQLEGFPLTAIRTAFRGLAPAAPELRTAFLADVARVLLRACARSWIDRSLAGAATPSGAHKAGAEPSEPADDDKETTP